MSERKDGFKKDEFRITDETALPRGFFPGSGFKDLSDKDLERLKDAVMRLQKDQDRLEKIRRDEPSNEFKQMFTCHSYLSLSTDIFANVKELCELDMSDALDMDRWKARTKALFDAASEMMMCNIDVMNHMRSLDVWKQGRVAEKKDDEEEE